MRLRIADFFSQTGFLKYCSAGQLSIGEFKKFQAPNSKSDKIISYHIDVIDDINLI